jgi:RNA polymerase sigma factor (TIGR02999 family)
MAEDSAEHVTQLLADARAGHAQAADELMQLIYGKLRGMAGRLMADVPPTATLEPTGLVHEAYVRLFGKNEPPWRDRGHFFTAAARAMRDVLVEQARKHASLKRGGGRKRVPFDETIAAPMTHPAELLCLEEFLQQLEEHDRTSAEVVMLRHFAGLTVQETAQAMDISRATVDRHWRFARAWLGSRIYDGGEQAGTHTDDC